MITTFHFEGAVYSNSLPYAMTLEDAKQWIKNWLNVVRLPKNIEYY